MVVEKGAFHRTNHPKIEGLKIIINHKESFQGAGRRVVGGHGGSKQDRRRLLTFKEMLNYELVGYTIFNSVEVDILSENIYNIEKIQYFYEFFTDSFKTFIKYFDIDMFLKLHLL